MNVFVIKLIFSIIVGGSYAVLMTWIAEKFGSKIGGLLIGLPSTSLIGYIFIALTQNPSVAVYGSIISPISIAAASFFAAAFVLTYPRFGGVISFLISILIWGILTFPFMLFKINNILLALFIGIIYIVISIFLVRKFSDQKIKNIKITPAILLIRGVISGTIIGLAVFLSKALGPLWGGAMAGFPGLFSSTIIVLLMAHGIGFTSSVAKRMPYGNLTSTAFAVGFFYFVPHLGMLLGTITAYSLAIITAIIIYFVIFPYQKKLSTTH